jgi:hypothetical protein
MSGHKGSQEDALTRIEHKIDIIEQKLDKFTERTTKLETQVGVITTGFIVLGAPILVAIITYLIQR